MFGYREQKWGLNTYLYAPKDDYKHRMYWRDLYSAEEAGESNITFIIQTSLGSLAVHEIQLWLSS